MLGLKIKFEWVGKDLPLFTVIFRIEVECMITVAKPKALQVAILFLAVDTMDLIIMILIFDGLQSFDELEAF